jgi:hypothetical protein
MMRTWTNWSRALVLLGIPVFIGAAGARAQQDVRRVALKSGESVVLRNYSFIADCRSTMIGTPTLDVLEGPEELSFALTEGTVIRRNSGCSTPVPGGEVVATAKDVKEPKEVKLTIRLNYNTKDGGRQSTSIFIVSLFP